MSLLITFAMKEEAGSYFDSWPLLFTGVGKVQAAMRLTAKIQRYRPSHVLNLGTAGSRNYPTGTLLNVTGFIQRDMDVTPLGIERYRTPFLEDPAVLRVGEVYSGMPQGICATGDSFDTEADPMLADAFDMESYALAYVCKEHNTAFSCIKYISDGADDRAADDWRTSLDRASICLYQAFEQLRSAGHIIE